MLYPTCSLSNPERSPTLRFPGSDGYRFAPPILRAPAISSVCVRSNPDRRSVIGRSSFAGNVVAATPLLLSDDPSRVVLRRSKMMRIPFFGAVVAFSALVGSPASAQHMIDEPGMYV